MHDDIYDDSEVDGNSGGGEGSSGKQRKGNGGDQVSVIQPVVSKKPVVILTSKPAKPAAASKARPARRAARKPVVAMAAVKEPAAMGKVAKPMRKATKQKAGQNEDGDCTVTMGNAAQKKMRLDC